MRRGTSPIRATARRCARRATVLLVAVLAAPAVFAGTVIKTESSETGLSKMMISGDRVRMESGGRVMLYDGAGQRMRFVEPAAKRYTVMTRQDVRRIGQQMDQMRAQMEKQLENVPADKREAMRQQMQSMLPGSGEPPSIRVEETGGSGEVAGTTCRKAKVYLDDQPRHEVCVAAPGAIGIPDGDFDTVLSMFDFFGEISRSMGGRSSEIGAREMRRLMSELGGMPVSARSMDGGISWEVLEVESRSIADDQFSIPSSYTERKGMGAMGQ